MKYGDAFDKLYKEANIFQYIDAQRVGGRVGGMEYIKRVTGCDDEIALKLLLRFGEFPREDRENAETGQSVVVCPFCNSSNTTNIPTTSKIIDGALFGSSGMKRGKQWYCNSCWNEF